jgi:hypothetical protein
MKRNVWLIVVLVASLAINAGVLAAYAYRKYDEWKHTKEFFRNWVPSAEHRFNVLIEKHMARMRSLREETRQARIELEKLGYADNADPKDVDYWLDKIGELERERALLSYQSGQGLDSLYPPGRKKAYERAWRRMQGLPPSDSAGSR